MILTLNQEDLKETLEGLVTALNTEEKHLDIYLSNLGGECAYGELIAHLINTNKDRITLTAFDVIASAAFEIFFNSKCERRLMPGTIGMFHQCYAKFTTNSDGRLAFDMDMVTMHRMKKRSLPELLVLLESIGATPAEIKRFKKGDDIWLKHERLAEMLKHQQSNIA